METAAIVMIAFGREIDLDLIDVLIDLDLIDVLIDAYGVMI